MDKELDQMAEALEKAAAPDTTAKTGAKELIQTLGPAGLKKAMASLSPEQLVALQATLEEMQLEKSHRQLIAADKNSTLETFSNSTTSGEYIFNEDVRPPYDAQDEVLVEEAVKRNQAEIRHQGGSGNDGAWDGQVIKSAAEPCQKCMTKSNSEKCDDHAEGGEKEPEMNLDDKKAAAKKNLKVMIGRMQDRKMEKAICVATLAKSLGASVEALSNVWDFLALAKSDVLAEKGNPEGAQSAPPATMKNGISGGVNDPEDPSVPKYEDKSAKKKGAEAPAGGKPHQTADEGMQPPKSLAKSNSTIWFQEDEMYLAKSENPFHVRTRSAGPTYSVDEYIALEAASVEDRLSKSTFDWQTTDGEVLAKGGVGSGKKGHTTNKIIAHIDGTLPLHDRHDHAAHEKFSMGDHADAEAIHRRLSLEAREKGDDALASHHLHQEHGHAIARAHKNEKAKQTQYENWKKTSIKKSEDASGEPTPQDVAKQNAKANSEAKKTEATNLRNAQVDSKLTAIQEHSAAKVPGAMLKASVLNDLIERSLDLASDQVAHAQATLTAKPHGAMLVKSFDDADMEALFQNESAQGK